MSETPFLGKKFAAFLFDMDGTVLTSIIAAERVWGAWARSHGLDVDAFLLTIHGKRSIDTVRQLALPGVDPEAEAAKITQAEIDDVEGVTAIDGVVEFLRSLPVDRWAIVTSAPRALALRRIEAAGIPMPPLLITSEDVSRGKPVPDCFLLGAERLGVSADQCLIFEDAPAGIAAAEAAGADVLVITTTHVHPYETAHPTIASYTAIEAKVDADGALTIVPKA